MKHILAEMMIRSCTGLSLRMCDKDSRDLADYPAMSVELCNQLAGHPFESCDNPFLSAVLIGTALFNPLQR